MASSLGERYIIYFSGVVFAPPQRPAYELAHMRRHQLLHPEITARLAAAGHGSLVLIADGNDPAATAIGPYATRVSLNLSPGLVSCEQVLADLLTACPVEAAFVMDYQRTGPQALGGEPPVWDRFRTAFANQAMPLEPEPIE
jgi:L-fucose mutarotase